MPEKYEYQIDKNYDIAQLSEEILDAGILLEGVSIINSGTVLSIEASIPYPLTVLDLNALVSSHVVSQLPYSIGSAAYGNRKDKVFVSRNYTKYFSISTPLRVVPGIYRYGWCCSYATDIEDSRIDIKIMINGNVVSEESFIPLSTGKPQTESGFVYLQEDSSIKHTIEVYVSTTAEADSAYITACSLELWRVNDV